MMQGNPINRTDQKFKNYITKKGRTKYIPLIGNKPGINIYKLQACKDLLL